jgi:Fe-S cluster biogenesis protein NfuA
MPAPGDLRAAGDRIERLLDELQASAAPGAYRRAEEVLRLVTELYGAGLARIVALARERAPNLIDDMAADDVELLGVDDEAGAVLLRLLGSCDGCPSSSVTLQMAVERAITEVAPEIVRIDVEPQPSPTPAVPVSIGAKPAYDRCPTEATP